MCQPMKRNLFPAWVAALLLPGAPSAARGQASPDAAAIADRQAAEERYQRLNSTVRTLEEAQDAIRKRLNTLGDDLVTVREDLAKSSASAKWVTHEELRTELKRLADKLQELDKKREDDKKLILDELRKLAAMPAPVPEPPRRPAPEPPLADKPNPSEKGYWYEIQPDDTISAVVAAYNQQGIRVTTGQVLKANPKLDPKRLRVGQKVWIPAPDNP